MKFIYQEKPHEDIIKESEMLKNQLQVREEYCAGLEEELVSLRCELENENNQLYKYQKLEKTNKILYDLLIN